MFNQSILAIVLFAAAVSALMSVMETLEKEKVVTEVLKKSPGDWLEVSWKSSGASAQGGNALTPTQVKQQPTVSWPNIDPQGLYLVCMTDPDAPSRQNPRNREWVHWLVANVPGDQLKMGEVIAAYVGAGPPKGSGLHRYVLAVYKQPNKLRMKEPHIPKTSGQGRANFSISRIAEKYNLGSPIAANFFQAEWDEYVPTLHKQLSGKA